MLSVIVPTFERPNALNSAVRSALAQAEHLDCDLEVVVVDDGSRTPIALDISDQRINILRLADNVGPAGARNAGIRACRGRLVALLDSDDIWLKGKLAAQVALHDHLCAEQTNGVVAIAGGAFMPSRIAGKLEARVPRPALRMSDFVTGCWFLPGSTLVVARSVFERVGPFDERLRRLEDVEWFLRFGRLGGRVYVVKECAAVVAPSRSATPATVDEAARIIEAMYGPSAGTPLTSTDWRRLRAYLELERSAAYIGQKRWWQSANHAMRSFWLWPRLRPQIAAQWQRSPIELPHVSAAFAQLERDGLADRVVRAGVEQIPN